jgi:nickel/cobalt transporter (NiCoT) family protein
VASGHVPFLAVLSLPILFAAGMCLMDTIDGAFMSKAYGWAFANPVRRIYYNMTVTGLSVAVALAIGGIEVLQVVSERFALDGGFWSAVGRVDFGSLGYAMVALFVITWVVAAVTWRAGRIEERWGRFVD